LTAPRLAGAVVLTGGTAARMDGADKAAIELEGSTLLERALAATVDAVEVVVVGEPTATSRPVRWSREEPPGGGPAAGLLAGVDRLGQRDGLVAVLAVDMPRVVPATFARLAGAVGARDGALLVDGSGRRQPLCAVYRCSALHAARPADRQDEPGLSVRRLLAPLDLVEVAAVGQEALDVDTWQDLRALGEGCGPSRGGRT
jgi:molybdopterin-guanine dinucleotide biosynthesis protein A